jgi:hypothetical protein
VAPGFAKVLARWGFTQRVLDSGAATFFVPTKDEQEELADMYAKNADGFTSRVFGYITRGELKAGQSLQMFNRAEYKVESLSKENAVLRVPDGAELKLKAAEGFVPAVGKMGTPLKLAVWFVTAGKGSAGVKTGGGWGGGGNYKASRFEMLLRKCRSAEDMFACFAREVACVMNFLATAAGSRLEALRAFEALDYNPVVSYVNLVNPYGDGLLISDSDYERAAEGGAECGVADFLAHVEYAGQFGTAARAARRVALLSGVLTDGGAIGKGRVLAAYETYCREVYGDACEADQTAFLARAALWCDKNRFVVGQVTQEFFASQDAEAVRGLVDLIKTALCDYDNDFLFDATNIDCQLALNSFLRSSDALYCPLPPAAVLAKLDEPNVRRTPAPLRGIYARASLDAQKVLTLA